MQGEHLRVVCLGTLAERIPGWQSKFHPISEIAGMPMARERGGRVSRYRVDWTNGMISCSMSGALDSELVRT